MKIFLNILLVIAFATIAKAETIDQTSASLVPLIKSAKTETERCYFMGQRAALLDQMRSTVNEESKSLIVFSNEREQQAKFIAEVNNFMKTSYNECAQK